MTRPSRRQNRLPHTQAEALNRAKTLNELVAGAPMGAARAAVHRVAISWWEAASSAADVALPPPSWPEDLGSVDRSTSELASNLGDMLSRLSPEDANSEIGALYARLLPSDHRKRYGVYYTSPPLVCRLLDQVEEAGFNWASGNVVDPACGAGAFLVEAARRICLSMRIAAPEFTIAAVSSRLRGWDLDPFAAWLAQLSVEIMLLPQTATSGKRIARITECRDSLDSWERDKGRFELVMGNPAFGRISDSPAIRARFGRSTFGHPNLYGLFTHLAVDLATKRGGLIAYVTPTSYLAGEYFKRLRQLLATEAPPVHVDILDHRGRHFDEVLQEVALSVFKRGARKRKVPSASLVVSEDMHLKQRGQFELPDDPQAPWIIARDSADIPLVEGLSSLKSRLRDWGYEVRTGPLVWNRKRKALRSVPSARTYPIIWAAMVRPEGKFDPLAATRRTHGHYHSLEESDANLVRQPCILLQRTTAKEQRRRLVAATLPASYIKQHGAVAVENHLNMVVPLSAHPLVPMAVLQAFLETDISDRVIRCISGSVALSASELEAMPLPAASKIIAASRESDFEAAVASFYYKPA